MPSRAPTYYHWSIDKPCTTNQNYGYLLRDSSSADVTKRSSAAAAAQQGPFDYTRPFSNSGFFPQITYKDRLSTAVRPRPLRPSKEYNPPSNINRFDINHGYSAGHVPVTKKLIRNELPAGVTFSRSVSAPPAYRYPQPRGKDIYLWHTLSGCLVHAKNYPPEQAF